MRQWAKFDWENRSASTRWFAFVFLAFLLQTEKEDWGDKESEDQEGLFVFIFFIYFQWDFLWSKNADIKEGE